MGAIVRLKCLDDHMSLKWCVEAKPPAYVSLGLSKYNWFNENKLEKIQWKVLVKHKSIQSKLETQLFISFTRVYYQEPKAYGMV